MQLFFFFLRCNGNTYSPQVSEVEEALVEVPVLMLKEVTGFVPTGEWIKFNKGNKIQVKLKIL